MPDIIPVLFNARHDIATALRELAQRVDDGEEVVTDFADHVYGSTGKRTLNMSFKIIERTEEDADGAP